MSAAGTNDDPVIAFDLSEAFDICRERNRPIVVNVEGEVGKCFPSGHYDHYQTNQQQLNEWLAVYEPEPDYDAIGVQEQYEQAGRECR